MALWTPAEITTALWLDASDSSSITIGTGVSNWADKSGNSNAAVQATTANQPPVISAEQNGLDVIRLDGANDGFTLSDDVENTESEWNIFFACNPASASDSTDHYLFHASGDLFILLQIQDTNKIGVYNNSLIDGPAATTGAQILHFDISSGGGYYRDGELLQSQSFSSIAIDGNIGLFRHALASSYVCDGDVFEVLFVKGSIDSSTRENIEGYLAWKWGLEANLDAGHTYKSAAPEIVDANELLTFYPDGGVVLGGAAAVDSDSTDANNLLSYDADGGVVFGGAATVDFLAVVESTLKEYAVQWPLPILPAKTRAVQWSLGYQVSTERALQYKLGYIIGASEERAVQYNLGYLIADRDEYAVQYSLGYLFESDVRDIVLDYDVRVDGARLESVHYISLTNTRRTYKNSATLTMAAAEDALLCAYGTTVTLSLMGVDLDMVVVSSGRLRAEDGWDYTVNLESPACLLDAPFARGVSGGLSGRAAAIAAAVAGGFALSWSSVDWPISAGLLDGSDRTPRELLALLADTAGGRLRSEFDGGVTVEPDYPVPLSLWSSAVPAYTLHNVHDLDSDAITQDTGSLYNAVEVGTSAGDDAVTDIKLDTVDNDDASVTLRIHMHPWDGTLVFTQTGGSAVSAALTGDVTRTETEIVQLVDGVGSLAYPVFSVLSTDYSVDALGSLTIDPDGTVTAAVPGESLAVISYTTRSRNYRITSSSGDDVLVVAETLDFAAVGSSVLVRTGLGDMEADGIFEELLTTDAVRRERGRNYLDGVSSRRETVTINGPLTALYRTGELMRVVDPVDDAWVGILDEQQVELGLVGDELTATSQLILEREVA